MQIPVLSSHFLNLIVDLFACFDKQFFIQDNWFYQGNKNLRVIFFYILRRIGMVP